MATMVVPRDGVRVKSGSGALARKEALWFYVLISPWLAGFVLFTGGPTIASAYLSLTHNDPVNWPPTLSENGGRPLYSATFRLPL